MLSFQEKPVVFFFFFFSVACQTVPKSLMNFYIIFYPDRKIGKIAIVLQDQNTLHPKIITGNIPRTSLNLFYY